MFSRFYGLLFYLWFALFRPQEWVWIEIEQYRLSLLVGLALIVPSFLTGILPNLTHPLSLGMIAFLGTALVGQINAFNAPVGWMHLELLARIILVSLFLVTLVDTRKRFVLTIAVLSGALGFHATKFGIGFLIRGGARFGEGIGGPYGSNNEFGLAIARIIFLLIATSQNVKSRWVRYGFMAAIPLSCFGLVSTFSRGAFLALAAGMFVFVLLQRRRVLSIAAVAAAIVGSTYMPIPEGYFNRLETIQTYEEVADDSALSRLHFWRVALLVAKDYPSGIGLRNFEWAYDQYDFTGGRYKTHRSVHNSHLQALVEAGYLGAALWVFLFGYAFWTAWRVRRRSKDPTLDAESRRFYLTTSNALMASMTAFVVGGTFGAEVLSDLNWFTFGLVAALHRLAFEPATAPTTVPSTVVAASPAPFSSRPPVASPAGVRGSSWPEPDKARRPAG